MKHLMTCAIAGIGITMLATGCQCPFVASDHREVYIATYTEKPITPKSFHAAAKMIEPEKAKVKFLWDKKNLYCYFYQPRNYKLTDSLKNKTKGNTFEFYISPERNKGSLGLSDPYSEYPNAKDKDQFNNCVIMWPILFKQWGMGDKKIEPGTELDVIVHFLKDGESPGKCTQKDSCWSKLKFVK